MSFVFLFHGSLLTVSSLSQVRFSQVYVLDL